MSLRLAKEGFGGGDPQRIERMPADIVLDAWEYLKFANDYLETAQELNKPKP